MENVPPFVAYAISLAAIIKYPIIFLGTVIEGPIVMMASGFLLHFGAFSLLPLYIALMSGDLVADMFWYFVGARFAGPFMLRFGKFFSLSPEMIEKLKKLIRKHDTLMLLGSKLTAGFGLALAMVIAAGASGVPFKKYMMLNFFGEILVTAMLLAVGYYFGQLYTYVDDSFKTIFMIGGSLFLLLAAYGFTRFVRSKAQKTLI
jgi:membrane protein DedA with SNARE-associated domain